MANHQENKKSQVLVRVCRKGSPCAVLVGNSKEVPQKIKNRTTI